MIDSSSVCKISYKQLNKVAEDLNRILKGILLIYILKPNFLDKTIESWVNYFALELDFSYMRLNATVNPDITIATILISLIRIFRLGPEVSLKGSPTVSPIIAALCAFEPFPPR